MFSPTIQKLIDLFSKFPTVGPRTAARFVFYLIKLDKKETEDLVNTIKTCNFCFNPFEKEGNLCEICQNPSRNREILCVVEKETDLNSIEKTNNYQGLYFILGGTVSKLKKEDIEKLPIKELKERIKNPQKFGIDTHFKEIIIATNPTPEGEATALYIERQLKNLNIKITHLARGLPTGGELEYADEETLKAAFEGRK
jgi:recombination protein RecR